MKNLTTTIFALILTLLISGTAMACTDHTSENEPVPVDNPNADSHVVFYIPHQDDDTLSFGVSIMNHLEAGHNVHVVLLTDGANSFVRNRLDMTKEQFSTARNREFLNAMLTMGVKRDHIYFEGIEDGTLTVAKAKPVIQRFEKLYPQAKHKAFSTLAGHSDHVNSGKALEELERSGVVTDARYYIQQAFTPTDVTVIKSKYKAEYATKLQKAASYYEVEASPNGLYGIGYKSVPKSFEAFQIQPVSRYHKLPGGA